jgi:5-methyltetrahydrofolate--homocysteine methyltransferase
MKKENILKVLQKKLLVCDGAMGTMLQEYGLSAGECPEYWNLTHPEQIKKIHEEYVKAGADLILANTFGGNRLKLEKFNLKDKLLEINTAGVKNAKAAAKENTFVGGDIGPTGSLLEPLGFLKESEALDVFSGQAETLAEAGADFIIIETMIALEEAVLAATAAKKTGLPVMALMTFDINQDDIRTVMGVDVPSMVKAFESAGVDIIGTNCGNGIDQMIRVVRAVRKETKKFIIAEPNAGLPILKDGSIEYSGTPAIMAAKVPELIEAGANIIGGCCGTTPAYIKLIKKEVERRNKK